LEDDVDVEIVRGEQIASGGVITYRPQPNINPDVSVVERTRDVAVVQTGELGIAQPKCDDVLASSHRLPSRLAQWLLSSLWLPLRFSRRRFELFVLRRLDRVANDLDGVRRLRPSLRAERIDLWIEPTRAALLQKIFDLRIDHIHFARFTGAQLVPYVEAIDDNMVLRHRSVLDGDARVVSFQARFGWLRPHRGVVLPVEHVEATN